MVFKQIIMYTSTRRERVQPAGLLFLSFCTFKLKEKHRCQRMNCVGETTLNMLKVWPIARGWVGSGLLEEERSSVLWDQVSWSSLFQMNDEMCSHRILCTGCRLVNSQIISTETSTLSSLHLLSSGLGFTNWILGRSKLLSHSGLCSSLVND